jgi:hypothetical protein
MANNMNEQQPLFEQPEVPNDEPPRYTLSDGQAISPQRLRSSDREIQLDAMRSWFYENYEDPVHNCPYISSEGGYQYIYGGPYDAREELEQEFSGIVDEDVIEELADELSDECPNWSGNTNNASDDFDDYLFRSSAESFRQEETFRQSALNIERLLEAKVEAAEYQCMLRLLYANVITALETYLSDKFISSINADEKMLRRFVETTPEFKSEKVPLSDVFNAHESIKQKVETYLVEVIWHRLDKVGPMFRDTLGIKFPPDVGELHKAIIVRHDCVHRSGRTKDGKERVLSEKDIKDLLSEAHKLVRWIEAGGKEPPTIELPSLDVPF